MGTRADFYVKRDDDLEWIGSINWHGQIEKIPAEILQSSSELEFTVNLEKFFSNRSDAMKADSGWSWHTEDSKSTDYVYIMWETKGSVFVSQHGAKACTIYQYRDYIKREKKAHDDSKEIESLKQYVNKVGSFIPIYPKMRGLNARDKKTRRPSTDGTNNTDQ